MDLFFLGIGFSGAQLARANDAQLHRTHLPLLKSLHDRGRMPFSKPVLPFLYPCRGTKVLLKNQRHRPTQTGNTWFRCRRPYPRWTPDED